MEHLAAALNAVPHDKSGQQILCKEYETHNIWQVITFTATKKCQLYTAHKQKDAEENI
jgi:hypothetical protein